MTDRLYYTDPYRREFDAVVERVVERDGKLAVTLDRTAFYPTSGGQPFDTGTLAGLRVVDVVDEDDGTIVHIVEPEPGTRERGTPEPRTFEPRTLEPRTPEPRTPEPRTPEPRTLNPERRTPNPKPGVPVHGSVDWPRRFDHMQQHTGQHVLSAAFVRLFDVRTVSFHLGAEVSTIDIAREATAAEIAAAETEANRVVWEDRSVGIRFVTAEEAAKLPLRKEPARGGMLRLIEVDDFDLSACGGTHVARTGAIGIIAVLRWERFKGGQRIEFACGNRALVALRSLRDATAASTRLLSVLPGELPGAIERLHAEARDRKRAVSALESELARYRAGELAASAEAVSVGKLVARAIDGDANALKSLAAAVTARPGYVVFLMSTSSPALVVVARSSDVTVSAQQVLTELVRRFGGRGGGRPELAQGGGLTGTPDEILVAARELIGAASP
jgi:alanyl-tRNA synthetase